MEQGQRGSRGNTHEQRKRDKCRHGGIVKEKVGSVQLTSQPDPCDGLMDVQKALIIFSQGLAVTQGPFCINKQELGKGVGNGSHLSNGVISSSNISTSTLLFI